MYILYYRKYQFTWTTWSVPFHTQYIRYIPFTLTMFSWKLWNSAIFLLVPVGRVLGLQISLLQRDCSVACLGPSRFPCSWPGLPFGASPRFLDLTSISLPSYIVLCSLKAVSSAAMLHVIVQRAQTKDLYGYIWKLVGLFSSLVA